MADAMGIATDKRIAPQEGSRETPIAGGVASVDVSAS